MQMQSYAQTIAADPVAFENGQREMDRILERSATDRAFREQLLTAPREALAAFANCDVSALPAIDLVFVEKRGDATIILPDFVDAAAELSERDLEAVAGGATPLFSLALVTSIAYGYSIYQAGHNHGDNR